jgi:hypothetical protein
MEEARCPGTGRILFKKPFNTSSGRGKSAKSGAASLGDQLMTPINGAIKVVIHDADRPESASLGQFSLGHSNTTLGLLRGISPAPETLSLDLGRGWLEQDEQ